LNREKSRVDSRDALSTKSRREHFGWHCPWYGALYVLLANVNNAE
jgi:hypothetical protein